MGCSSCKQKKEITPITKKEVEELSHKVEKIFYAFFGVLILLASYGFYSLLKSFT